MMKFDNICLIDNQFQGSETSAITLSWTILMLAMHPEIQEKVYEEIRNTIDLSNENLAMDATQLNELVYTDIVFKETMRLFPIGLFIPREITGDGIILSNGVHLPAGINICIDVFNLHREESIWGSDASQFNPDRFDDDSYNRHPYSYIPFSAGPRNCIGYKYALIAMKVELIHLLKHFQFKTSLRMDDLEFKYETILKPDNKFMVQLMERKVFTT
jgi:cytochrome P450 family 4